MPILDPHRIRVVSANTQHSVIFLCELATCECIEYIGDIGPYSKLLITSQQSLLKLPVVSIQPVEELAEILFFKEVQQQMMATQS